MKKLITVLLVVATMVSLFAVSASANASEPTVMPRWTNTSNVIPSIAFENGVGSADLAVTAKYSPKTITIDTYVYLESGSDWIYVNESHVTKTGMVCAGSCSFDAVAGETYKAEYYVTVVGGGVTEELSFTETKTNS